MSSAEKVSFLMGLIAAGSSVIGWLLFVIFGQVTVRKLRKNPATRNGLGIEFMSGWDIINAASALARPARLSRRLERGGLRELFADSRAIRTHTTRLDRVLGRACCGTLLFSVICTVIWILLPV